MGIRFDKTEHKPPEHLTYLKMDISPENIELLEKVYAQALEQEHLILRIYKGRGFFCFLIGLINYANSIIEEISKFKGDEKQVIQAHYVKEKIGTLVLDFNAMTRDYNLYYGTDYAGIEVE